MFTELLSLLRSVYLGKTLVCSKFRSKFEAKMINLRRSLWLYIGNKNKLPGQPHMTWFSLLSSWFSKVLVWWSRVALGSLKCVRLQITDVNATDRHGFPEIPSTSPKAPIYATSMDVHIWYSLHVYLSSDILATEFQVDCLPSILWSWYLIFRHLPFQLLLHFCKSNS